MTNRTLTDTATITQDISTGGQLKLNVVAVGTPLSGVLTNCTGTAAGLTAGAVSTISGKIAQGANITLTGSGTNADPYTIAAASGSGTSALWQAVSFSTTIPLNQLSVMPYKTVSGALTFTPGSNPQAGASCYVILNADGTHYPTFSGFKESGQSSGYNNTSGVENEIQFWYDGTYSWFMASQEANAVPLLIPTISSAGTSDATHIVLTFSASLNASSVPATSAFAPKANGSPLACSAVAISGTQVTLTVATMTSGQTITCDYTAPGSNMLQNAATTVNVASFTGQSVTNNISADTHLLAHWLLTGGSGTSAADLTGNGHTASFVGTPTWVSDGLSVSTGNFLDAGIQNLGATDITLSMRIKTTDTGVVFVFGGWDQGAGGANQSLAQITLGVGAAGHPDFYTAAGGVRITGSAAINNGVLHLLTYVVSGTTAYIYVDGTQVASGSAGSVTWNGWHWYIGGDLGSTSVTATIKEVWIYNRALSSGEIAAQAAG